MALLVHGARWHASRYSTTATSASYLYRAGYSTSQVAFLSSSSPRRDQRRPSPSDVSSEKGRTKAKEKVAMSKMKLAEEDERIRQILLERDGGPASVPTREGKWDQDMGRETSRQMHRVLDQVRVNKPGTNTSLGQGESKYFSR